MTGTAGTGCSRTSCTRDDRDAVLEQLYTSLANGDDVRCEYRMRSDDGRWVEMRMEAVAITDD